MILAVLVLPEDRTGTPTLGSIAIVEERDHLKHLPDGRYLLYEGSKGTVDKVPGDNGSAGIPKSFKFQEQVEKVTPPVEPPPPEIKTLDSA